MPGNRRHLPDFGGDMTIRQLAVSLGIVSIVATGCASGPGPSAGATSNPPSSSHGMDGTGDGSDFAFGEPAEPSDADRTVQVAALDTLRFDPASIEVGVGETITFEVTNAGALAHEFVLGDATTQDEHQGDMGGMDGSMTQDEANIVPLDPSVNGSLTWTFTQPGTVLFACHVDDHYAAGMIGEIVVGTG